MRFAVVLALVAPLVAALPVTQEMGVAIQEREAYVPPAGEQKPGDCLIMGKSCIVPSVNKLYLKIKSGGNHN